MFDRSQFSQVYLLKIIWFWVVECLGFNFFNFKLIFLQKYKDDTVSLFTVSSRQMFQIFYKYQ